MKPYQSYKKFSSHWFDDVPEHWDVVRIGGLLAERKESNAGPITENILSVLKDIGVINYEDKGDIGNKKSEDIERYQLVHEGDIVVNSMNIIIGSVGMAKEFGALSPVYYVLKPRTDSVYMPFYNYIFQTKTFQRSLVRIGYGILAHRMRIPFIELKKQHLPFPPFSEQQAITDFLDRKTAQIDTLIEKKQRQIDLLQEQRTALINYTVTKGLNPNVRMKDSGVEWLGEIPSHWKVAKLSYLTERIGDGLHGTPEYVDTSDYYFINGNNLVKGEIQFFESTKCVSKDEFKKYDVGLNNKTILLSINGTIGNVAFYRGEKVMLGKSAAYIVFQDDLLKNYFFHYLQSTPIQNYFGLESTGTTIYNLSLKTIRSTPLPLPPDDEKKAIADYLNKQQLEFEKATDIIIRQIDTLKEYRTALISEAVTGKIDVRTAV